MKEKKKKKGKKEVIKEIKSHQSRIPLKQNKILKAKNKKKE